MNINFPENLFPVPKHLASIYKYKVKQGISIAQSKSIVFCGIGRDVGNVLELNILRLQKTGSHFKNYKIVIYENDSADNTKDILEKYKSYTLEFITSSRDDKDYKKDIDTKIDPWHSNRCRVLAECRNIYLNHIKNLDYDYACVLDLDLKGGWSYDGFFHALYTIESNKKYAAVTSYGILSDRFNSKILEECSPEELIMYDSFAFRPKSMNFPIHFLNTAMFNKIYLQRGSDPQIVRSNFGGMAIYKKSILNNYQYGSKEWDKGQVDPDHVVLHDAMNKDGYSIVLDPSMIVSYSDHTYSLNRKK
jgi:hypothetical protein